MSKIIGIDLGTSKCCVSVVIDGKPIVLLSSEGNRTTSSVVSFLNDGSILVGDAAKGKAIINAEYTIMNIKNLMGKRWSDLASLNSIGNISYKIERHTGDNVVINGRGSFYTPQQICSILLKRLKNIAEEYLNESVTEAVITVPAYFTDAQRQATREAGILAGLKVRRIINEPTAAALAYGLNKTFSNDKDNNIAVFDLGGGTFDISILQLGDGVFEVKSTNGDSHLGGNDFDFIIMNWLIEEFFKEEQIDLRTDPTALQRLKDAAEKAKIELSSSSETDIRIDYITSKNQSPKHINKVFTQALFEKRSEQIFNQIKNKCETAIKMADLSSSQIAEVIMVGESCHIPKIAELVENVFGRKPRFGVNLVEAVAIGAAIEGAVLTGDIKNVLLLDVTPLDLGIELGNLMHCLIKANTTIPTIKSEVYTTSSDNQASVEIHVLQGNRPMANQNTSLGKFIFDISPAPKGIPQIEVKFEIDADGILHVSAKDKNSGRLKKVRIEYKFD